MRKSDKKIENQLRAVLTEVCHVALKDISGFQWLTHLVNYSDFPGSLKVVCVFDSTENLSSFMAGGRRDELGSLIQSKLTAMGVKLKNVASHIVYDTEEYRGRNHNGKWADRLR